MTELHIESLRKWVDRAAVRNEVVSGWSIGQHLHHCGLAMVGTCDALLSSTPPAPRTGFSFPRSIVLMTGWIPRGRAKAPDVAVPDPEPRVDEIVGLLDRAGQGVDRVQAGDPRVWFRHPLLGPMKRETALRFLAIHNRHHLRLMRDIAEAAVDR